MGKLDGVEPRTFKKASLPRPMTSPGKFGEGTRKSGKTSNESSMAMTNKDFTSDGLIK